MCKKVYCKIKGDKLVLPDEISLTENEYMLFIVNTNVLQLIRMDEAARIIDEFRAYSQLPGDKVNLMVRYVLANTIDVCIEKNSFYLPPKVREFLSTDTLEVVVKDNCLFFVGEKVDVDLIKTFYKSRQ